MEYSGNVLTVSEQAEALYKLGDEIYYKILSCTQSPWIDSKIIDEDLQTILDSDINQSIKDKVLKCIGYKPPTKYVPPNFTLTRETPDGACLFRALARAYLDDPERHNEIRQEICNQLSDYFSRIHPDFQVELDGRTIDEYVTYMRKSSSYGGEPEIVLFTQIYNFNLVVFAEGLRPKAYWGSPDKSRTVYVLHGNTVGLKKADGRSVENHYDTLIPENSEKAFASILRYFEPDEQRRFAPMPVTAGGGSSTSTSADPTPSRSLEDIKQQLQDTLKDISDRFDQYTQKFKMDTDSLTESIKVQKRAQEQYKLLLDKIKLKALEDEESELAQYFDEPGVEARLAEIQIELDHEHAKYKQYLRYYIHHTTRLEKILQQYEELLNQYQLTKAISESDKDTAIQKFNMDLKERRPSQRHKIKTRMMSDPDPMSSEDIDTIIGDMTDSQIDAYEKKYLKYKNKYLQLKQRMALARR